MILQKYMDKLRHQTHLHVTNAVGAEVLIGYLLQHNGSCDNEPTLRAEANRVFVTKAAAEQGALNFAPRFKWHYQCTHGSTVLILDTRQPAVSFAPCRDKSKLRSPKRSWVHSFHACCACRTSGHCPMLGR